MAKVSRQFLIKLKLKKVPQYRIAQIAKVDPVKLSKLYIRQIKNHFPRKPGGRPRAYEVDLAQQLWAQGKSDLEVGAAIEGEAEWPEKPFMERRRLIKRLRSAVEGRAYYRRKKKPKLARNTG